MATVALAFLVIALALGAFSSMIFAWQWIIGAPTPVSSSVLLIAVAVGSVALFLYLKRRVPQSPVKYDGRWILFGLAFAFAGYWMIQHAKVTPHGGWDAWTDWNLHARFLYRGATGLWREVFDPALFWSHNDYPLLVPGLVDGIWTVMGSEQPIVPALVASFFALLVIGIVYSATSAFSGDQRGWLAGLVLLATPSFLLESAAQRADMPLSLYILTTVVLLQFAEAWPGVKMPMLALGGLSAGFAAWTKNEGLLFVIAVFISRWIAVALLGAWHGYRKDVIRIGLGLVPILILILSFKALLAPPGDIPLNASAIERITHVERYPQIAVGFVRGFMSFGDTVEFAGTNPAILMVLYLLLYISPIRRVSVTSLSLLLLPVLMLCGYFMVYVITPYSPQWHMNNSLDRLLLQLWPACVFILATVPLSMLADRTAEPTPTQSEDVAR